MPRRPKAKLTEAEWSRVFNVRCRAKQGQALSPDDQKLIETAFKEDFDRYAAMNDRIYEATKPFGAL